MYKNLSKPRFILIICVAIFLLVILLAQFIALSVLRNKNQNLDEELLKKEQILNSTNSNITKETLEDDLRKNGYIYNGETVVVEQ